MKTIKYFAYILSFSLILGACEQELPDLTDPEADNTNVDDETCPEGASGGSADFSKYVAIGNSLTAGFQAGALFNEGQANSLGNILATQFECVGGGEFNQPDINSENGFYTSGPNPINGVFLGRLRLQGTPPAPKPMVSDAASAPSPLNPAFQYTGDKTALNNFGVPGIQLGQILIPQTGDWSLLGADPRVNPFYARFASDPGTSTILGDAMAALADGGTFFSFWLGNNDVLGYAVGGASNPAIFTSEANFTAYFNAAMNTLLSLPADVKGVVGNIPDVTAIPYFNTVKYNAIPLDETKSGQLNAGFAGYNQVLDGLAAAGLITAADADNRKISFTANSTNRIVITDETLNDLGDEFDILVSANQMTAEQRAMLAPYEQVRQATATDLITLSAGAVLGTTVGGNPLLINGLTVPLGDQYVLIPTETQEVKARTTAFNTIIANKVNSSDNRLALADVNAKFTALATAKFEVVNGVTFTPTLAPPTGGFSEDGVHPNSRGVAYMANIFIDAINAKFGASIPKANLAKFSATGLPINP